MLQYRIHHTQPQADIYWLDKKFMTTLLSHGDGEFESRQLCGHEQGLLDELVPPAATVLC